MDNEGHIQEDAESERKRKEEGFKSMWKTCYMWQVEKNLEDQAKMLSLSMYELVSGILVGELEMKIFFCVTRHRVCFVIEPIYYMEEMGRILETRIEEGMKEENILSGVYFRKRVLMENIYLCLEELFPESGTAVIKRGRVVLRWNRKRAREDVVVI